jgi:hypothetical protein
MQGGTDEDLPPAPSQKARKETILPRRRFSIGLLVPCALSHSTLPREK